MNNQINQNRQKSRLAIGLFVTHVALLVMSLVVGRWSLVVFPSLVVGRWSLVEQSLTSLSRMPQLWNVLRWIAEAGYRRHYEVIEHELTPWSDTSRRFLDLGCGTGQFAHCFPAHRYVGVDPTRPYISYAGRNRAGSFSVMDGSRLGLEGGFDGALVLGVFHHLPDEVVAACMAELGRVLKPDGTLLVIEDIPPPNAANIPGHIMHWLDRGEHIRTDRDYRALFAPTFEVRSTYTMRSGICDYQVYVLAHTAQP